MVQVVPMGKGCVASLSEWGWVDVMFWKCIERNNQLLYVLKSGVTSSTFHCCLHLTGNHIGKMNFSATTVTVRKGTPILRFFLKVWCCRDLCTSFKKNCCGILSHENILTHTGQALTAKIVDWSHEILHHEFLRWRVSIFLQNECRESHFHGSSATLSNESFLLAMGRTFRCSQLFIDVHQFWVSPQRGSWCSNKNKMRHSFAEGYPSWPPSKAELTPKVQATHEWRGSLL